MKNKLKCSHKYGKWEKYIWTEEVDEGWWDAYWVSYTRYGSIRKCKLCGDKDILHFTRPGETKPKIQEYRKLYKEFLKKGDLKRAAYNKKQVLIFGGRFNGRKATRKKVSACTKSN